MTVSNRSPLRLRRSPWITDVDLERILLLRGAFVAGAGQVETILTEMAIRASKHPAYASVRAEFPRHRNERFSYLKDLCDRDGPLLPCKGLIVKIVDLFAAAAELRDTFAHGRMEAFTGGSDGVSMRFSDWQVTKRKKLPADIKLRVQPMKLSELERYANRMARLSRAVESLYYRPENVLPPVM